MARSGQSPDLTAPVQVVQVRDLGGTTSVVDADGFNFRDFARILRRRQRLVLITAATVLALSAAKTGYERIFRPVYSGSFSLLITDPISTDGSGGGNNSVEAANGTMFEALARNSTRNDIPTLIEVLRSPVLLQPVAARFGLSSSNLASRIKIATGGDGRQSKAEGVLNVNLTGGDPVADQKLLSALSEAYLQAALQQRQQRLADGLSFLNKQAPVLEAKTNELQAELAAFRERYKLLEPTEEGIALKEQLANMEVSVMNIQADRARLITARRDIASGRLSARSFQEAIGGGAGSSSGGSSSGSASSSGGGLTVSTTDQSLLQQLQEVETELATARSKYNQRSSIVQGLEARLRQLQPLLRQSQLDAVDAALILNTNRLATSQRQLEALTARFLKQPALIKQYDDLQQKLKLAQANLAGLVSARETFQLEIAQRSVPWRVIAPPTVNPIPIEPSVPRNLMQGLLLGLVAGAGAGLLRDRLDHVFHHPGEVKDELGLPLLGHIPHVNFFQGVREDKRFLLQELDTAVNGSDADNGLGQQQRYQRFFYQEAFRNLFTSLRFLNSDHPLKSVALTSSLPAEGKSLVNVLLAKTLSEMGQRVLLIDADLRKPQMHHRLGINNLSGLSNLLTDDNQHWRQVVQRVEGYDNWSVISAGRRPPDPTRLLSSQRMHQLVAELTSCGDFDLVLFDTPPVLGLADAALVAEHCDGLMLLVSLGRVDRGLPREAVNRIRSSGAPLLGIVTNAIKEATQSATGYGYGYGYGYGATYGYGGYGYAAYDTSATYAYYSEEEASSPSSRPNPLPGNSSALQGWKRWRSEFQQRQRRFLQWLDH